MSLPGQLGVACKLGDSWEVVAVLSMGMGCFECGCHSPLVARAWRQERGAEVLMKAWGPQREFKSRS